jgi:hypothetical protein
LLMHGELDKRVPISHSLKLMKELDANHKVYEWIKFEEEGHGLTYVKDSYKFYVALFKFLDKYNPPDPKPDQQIKAVNYNSVDNLTIEEIKHAVSE